MKYMHIDLETYSSVPLPKTGVYPYAESTDFEILLFGASVDGGPVRVYDLAQGGEVPEDVLAALTDDGVIKYAHNASFERICLSRYLRDKGVLGPGEYLRPEGFFQHFFVVVEGNAGLCGRHGIQFPIIGALRDR